MWKKGETPWMTSGCFVSGACACVNKEMSKVNTEGTISNADLWPQDAGEVQGKRVGGFAEVMCLLSRERVDTGVLYCLKTLVARPVREHSGRRVLLRGEINVFSVLRPFNEHACFDLHTVGTVCQLSLGLYA
jgi:hypothetical protein